MAINGVQSVSSSSANRAVTPIGDVAGFKQASKQTLSPAATRAAQRVLTGLNARPDGKAAAALFKQMHGL